MSDIFNNIEMEGDHPSEQYIREYFNLPDDVEMAWVEDKGWVFRIPAVAQEIELTIVKGEIK